MGDSFVEVFCQYNIPMLFVAGVKEPERKKLAWLLAAGVGCYRLAWPGLGCALLELGRLKKIILYQAARKSKDQLPFDWLDNSI